MPLRYTSRLIDHLAHPGYRPETQQNIARDLRVSSEERDLFQKAVVDARDRGLIEQGDDERLRLPKMPSEIAGKLRLHKKGFGFVQPSQKYREGDLYIPRGACGDAMSGDTVRASVSQGGRWKGRGSAGRIEEVLQRGRSEFVGSLFKRGKAWFVQPDGRELHDPVIVRDVGAKNAKADQKVAFEMIHYPEEDYYGEGVITRVLGDAGKPDIETQAVMLAFGLSDTFPEEVVDEARQATTAFEGSGDEHRDELSDRLIFTIDPPDARDFDDAIDISFDEERGEWELGVHIADVASFVISGSALDQCAAERGNSVYLPRHVVPMLPEVLSNGVCSLQEGVRRWAKSVFIRFDRRGRVLGQRLRRTVIRSEKRFTYLEAQAVIDGDLKAARSHAATSGEYTDALAAALRRANELARTLLKRRRRDGMIELALPEVELEFDDEGHVIDAHPEDDAFTHRIIEMFMVEANEAVARVFAGLDVPVIRRIHPEPKFGDMEDLQLFARSVGLGIPEEPTRQDLQRILQATAETPAARAVHFAVLRTLTRAIYSPAIVGHFALASEHYAHFTSPIRRYPDLIIHRAIEAFLDHTDNGTNVPRGKGRRALGQRLMDDKRVLAEGKLVELGQHCSETERNAEDAERSLRNFLVLQFLSEHHLGDEFLGIVTGFLATGLFVSLERFLVEGLAKFESMGQSSSRADRWNRIQGTGQVIAERSGAVLAIGDQVTAQIVAIDLPTREMELRLTAMPDRASGQERSSGDTVRRKGKKRRKGR